MNRSFPGRRVASLFAIFFFAPLACFAEEDTQQLLKEARQATGLDRYDAIDDLGEQAQQAEVVVPALLRLLADPDTQVQWRAARSLGDFEGSAEGAVRPLTELLASPDAAVQYHAAVALARIGNVDEATIDALVSLAIGPDARVARAAIASLRRLKASPQIVAAALKQAMASDDQAVVVHAMEAVVELGPKAAPLLIEALQDPRTVYVACGAIEQMGADAAPTVPALDELLATSKHSHLQIQALLALASIGPPARSATGQIVTLMNNSQDATAPVAAAYALGAIGAVDADAALRAAAKKHDPLLQMMAVWALAKIHPDDEPLRSHALELLHQGLTSKEPAVHDAAEKAIAALSPASTAADPKP